MRIVLHTLGDPVTGMGHIFRCLAIAEALQTRFPMAEILFALDAGAEGRAVVAAAGRWPMIDLALGAPPPVAADVLIVDRPEIPEAAMRPLRRCARVLVSLDDPGPARWLADIAVGGLYAPRTPRPAESRTRSLDGLSMVSLDASFRAGRHQPRAVVEAVMLTQGGSDTYGLVPRLATALGPWLARHADVTLHVHTGPAFRHEEALAPALARLPRVERHRRVPDLAALYSRMDLAVAAGGVMACELAAVGVPLVLVTGEPKELETAGALAREGAAILAGFWEGTGGGGAAERVVAAVSELSKDASARLQLGAAGRRAVDGRGLDRLVDAIVEAAARPTPRPLP